MKIVATAIASAVLVSFAAAAPHVWVVDAQGHGDFFDVQSALAQSVDGDVIVLRGGNYAAFVLDAKGVTIAAQPGANVSITGTIVVRNLAAGSSAVLCDLVATGATSVASPSPAMRATNNAGNLRLDHCTMHGSIAADGSSYPGLPGGNGIELNSCLRVMCIGCSLRGADGDSQSVYCDDCTGGNGGDGVVATNTAAAFYDCDVTGGAGGDTGEHGGNGGSGCRVSGFGIFASGCNFSGGSGGYAGDFIAAYGGNGGDGLNVGSTAQAQLVGDLFVGGAAGKSFLGNDGQAGQALTGSGVIHSFSGSARRFSAARVTTDATTWTVDVSGEPGDRVWLASSDRADYAFMSKFVGVRGVPYPFTLTKIPLGIIPTSGSLSIDVPIGDYAPNVELHRSFWQGVIVDASGAMRLSSPLDRTVLNCDAVGSVDCNGNAVNDFCDLVNHTSSDCDADGTPDECDVDCNHNGIADACDLANHTSTDCNGDGIPDECENLPDCNGNGIPDACDLANHTSTDCDHDGIPDECDLPDCNGNGKPDSCDIANGVSQDFNHDGIPDECELASNTYYVDASAPAGGDGSSAHPFKSIGAGIGASITGDSIVVRDGTYSGAGNVGLMLSGRGVALTSEHGAASCIVDLQNLGSFLSDNGGGKPAIVRGFTVRNGSNGAIMHLGTDLTVSQCRFENCHGASTVLIGYAHCVVSECAFDGCSNSAGLGNGGAVYIVTDVNASGHGLDAVEKCTFTNCSAIYGGAVYTHGDGAPVISHCRFFGNSATSGGGAVATIAYHSFGVGSGLAIDDSLFAGNSAPDGGAIFQDGNPSLTTIVAIANCTFTANSAANHGGAIHVKAPTTFGQMTLSNSILWNDNAPNGAEISTAGTVDVSYCDVAGGQVGVFVAGGSLNWGGGNLATNPLFVDSDGADNVLTTWGDDDFHLAAGSPCIDAGNNALAGADVLDLDGDSNFSESIPFDLDLGPRFKDDPSAPDTGSGTPPIIDLGVFER